MAEYINGITMDILFTLWILSLTADELEQFLKFKGLLLKKLIFVLTP